MLSIKSLFQTYRYSLSILFALIAIVTGLSLAIPTLTGQMIKSFEARNTDWNTIYMLLGVALVLFVVEVIQVVYGARFRERVGYDLRDKLLKKVVTQDYTKVNQIGIGQIITLFGSDINNVKDIMAGELVNSIKAILIFIGALIIIFANSWQLGLISFVSLPVIIGAFGLIFKSVTKFFAKSQVVQTDLNNAISQNIYGVNLVKVQNSQKWETDKFDKLTLESREVSFNIINAFSALIPIINVVTNWTVFGILYFGALQYIAGQIKLGDINAYISYYALLSGPIFIIGFNSQGIARMGVSIKRLNELLQNSEMVETGTHKEPITNGIQLTGVNLEYAGKKILKDINLNIKIGQKTAILGPTGAGKSQLIGLLTGIIQPTSGTVQIDKKAINDWSTDYIKDRMTTVFQESLIFSGDLKSNVILNRKYDESKYNKAMETATLDELVKTKGDISELGGNLSGGQKQRLTLARALYNQPQILILDDFTARVDSATETKIQSLLAKNYPDTTIIAISQNIETIKDYDQIILVMEGELLATGSHTELLKTSPEYQQIQQSQKTI
jgi:ATP-binding cassette, subfamily B, bacterial